MKAGLGFLKAGLPPVPPPPFGVAPGIVTITASSANSYNWAQTVTASSVYKILLVNVVCSAPSAPPARISSVTWNGIAAKPLSWAYNNNSGTTNYIGSETWYILVPPLLSDVTADVIATFAANVGTASVRTYIITNPTNHTVYDWNSATNNPGDAVIDERAGGCVVAFSSTRGVVTTTYGGVTKDAENTIAGAVSFSSGSIITPSTVSAAHITATRTGTFPGQILLVAAFR